ncbi:hypothetical protein BDR06DRAFT_960468 [Suillus hirtellus]|nr:hypothetical protein BDR06DRAFT_960468 [Suillus hirtellus]
MSPVLYPSRSLYLCTSTSTRPCPDPLSFTASLHHSSLSYHPNTISHISTHLIRTTSHPIRSDPILSDV